MSIFHNLQKGCGQVIAGPGVAVIHAAKSRHNPDMTILPRLISIAMRKYKEHPGDQKPAVQMLLRNAVRLAIAHLGREQASVIVTEALQERKA